ncbi:AAEL015427-PA [Aedes aegypti]|uniref:AAEL015427-PA n=1 Tax=Aedes aegypti TaxID=7159 RepID=Q1DGY3_AEDAE|nr:AAEL015427-PA [Aedes aegypti]
MHIALATRSTEPTVLILLLHSWLTMINKTTNPVLTPIPSAPLAYQNFPAWPKGLLMFIYRHHLLTEPTEAQKFSFTKSCQKSKPKNSDCPK